MTRREKLRRQAERKEDLCEWIKIILGTIALGLLAILICLLV